MEIGYRHICNHCARNATEEGCWRNQEHFDDGKGPCKSIKCFVVRLTPVDKTLKEGQLPDAIARAVANDVLIFGQAFVEKSTYERVAYGQTARYDQYIHYPAEQLTIEQIKTWGKRQGFTKYPKP